MGYYNHEYNGISQVIANTSYSYHYWISFITVTGLILGLHPANERRRYFVMASLIGWVQAKNQPCCKLV